MKNINSKVKFNGLKTKAIDLWKNKKPLAIAIIVVILLLLIGAGVAIAMNASGSGSDGGVEDSMIDTDGDGVPDAKDSDGDGIPDSEDTDNNTNGQADGSDDNGSEDDTKNGSDDGSDDSDEDSMIDTDGDGVPDAKDVDGDGIPDSEDDNVNGDMNGDGLPDLAEGSYEQWLAAGMVTGISMYYFEHEFDIKSIYIASETELNNSEESKGAYVVFTVDGNEKVVQSLPLEDERSDKGTVDLYARNFGYATFDEVDVTDAELKKCTEVKFSDLEIYINQLLLPTIYER